MSAKTPSPVQDRTDADDAPDLSAQEWRRVAPARHAADAVTRDISTVSVLKN
jgi:hypothetical protein